MIKRRIPMFVISIIILIIAYKFNIFLPCQIEGHHFDIITVNSIFAGFLFSSLSLLLGLGKNGTIVFLQKIEKLDKIYFKIVSGIIFAILSIIISLLNQFVKLMQNDVSYILELYFLFMLIITFIGAVKDMIFVLKALKKEIMRELPDQSALDHAIKKIKS